ncbi:MAG: monovalent cation/H(+) antiporter subunit G [Spirochaetales bacterium]|nr:monovalent cation/H(+) antiporter subunit G [Spirochaetales bacterium]MCF7939445.1 monovalent cation/H(+) antiporter subunit G [Spirochaetales bacterium]
MDIAGTILVVIGSVFLFFGALGIIRMPDFFNRIQAGTKATTLGAMSLILGVGFLNPSFLTKSIVLVVFIMLTNPISSSTIARSGYRAGMLEGGAELSGSQAGGEPAGGSAVGAGEEAEE